MTLKYAFRVWSDFNSYKSLKKLVAAYRHQSLYDLFVQPLTIDVGGNINTTRIPSSAE